MVTLQYCTQIYCSVVFCTALFYTALPFTVLHCSVLQCTALHCSTLHCSVMKCNISHALKGTVLLSILSKTLNYFTCLIQLGYALMYKKNCTVHNSNVHNCTVIHFIPVYAQHCSGCTAKLPLFLNQCCTRFGNAVIYTDK